MTNPDAIHIPPEREIAYLQATLIELQAAGPHYTRDLGMAVARIHKRLDELQQGLA